MGFRLAFSGDPSLSRVAASVVERLAREAGLREEQARDVADGVRHACNKSTHGAPASEIRAGFRSAKLRVHVDSQEGEIRLTGHVTRGGRPRR